MADCIPYKDIPYFSGIAVDYLSENKKVKQFYHRFPSLDNLKKQLDEKGNFFSDESRKTLVTALKNQYESVDASKKTRQNIQALGDKKTFTVTTGHQLNLFTGPLYFFYKIISTINLTKALKKAHPAYNFVPIYWMASEDHDFEEINFFNFKDKEIRWRSPQKGAVGEFSTKGLAVISKIFEEELNTSKNAESLLKLFKEAYVEHNNLTEATRFLANALFKDHGLVILDGNDKTLKREFSPYVKSELLKQTSFEEVEKSTEKLTENGYKIQVTPREINLFYLTENSRERLIKRGGDYFVNETEMRFSEAEILGELDAHPERFSPNVIMRPLYQEVVLPNLCYIGGSGELAYWLQLKSYFDAENVVFPSLLLRNSALLMSKKQRKKLKKLRLSEADLFKSPTALDSKQTKAISEIPIDFSPQKKHLQQQFNDLYDLAKKTDKSFIGAVAAQEKKQLNGLAHLEKRLLKAQKRKLKDELARATDLQEELFPHRSLQERTANFSEFYEVYGQKLISVLFDELEPLDMRFRVITL